MAANDHTKPDGCGAAAGVPAAPRPRLRLPLNTAEDARRELARLYREAKTGGRDVSEASKLANMLAILARMIETGDLEARIEALEAAEQNGGRKP